MGPFLPKMIPQPPTYLANCLLTGQRVQKVEDSLEDRAGAGQKTKVDIFGLQRQNKSRTGCFYYKICHWKSKKKVHYYYLEIAVFQTKNLKKKCKFS